MINICHPTKVKKKKPFFKKLGDRNTNITRGVPVPSALDLRLHQAWSRVANDHQPLASSLPAALAFATWRTLKNKLKRLHRGQQKLHTLLVLRTLHPRPYRKLSPEHNTKQQRPLVPASLWCAWNVGQKCQNKHYLRNAPQMCHTGHFHARVKKRTAVPNYRLIMRVYHRGEQGSSAAPPPSMDEFIADVLSKAYLRRAGTHSCCTKPSVLLHVVP